METEYLKNFVILARTGSVRRAAEELGLSSATLSARMRALEKSVGASLFDGRARSFALSEEGTLFLPRAQEILARYESLHRELDSAKRQSFTRLRIAISGTGLPMGLGPFMDRLNLMYPDLRIDLYDGTQYSIADGVRSGAVDLYFAAVAQGFECEGVGCTRVGDAKQKLLVPVGHRLANRASVNFRELDGERFILYPSIPENCIRDFQLRNLEASGIRYTTYETDSAPALYPHLVPVGKGLVLLPNTPPELPPMTTWLALRDLPFPAQYYVFYAPDAPAGLTGMIEDYLQFEQEMLRHEH